jgi:hypothetical protein
MPARFSAASWQRQRRRCPPMRASPSGLCPALPHRMAGAKDSSRTPGRCAETSEATSRAEFAVARHAYVSTSCGWFSDRSAASLAIGRPVVVQNMRFSAFLPSGAGPGLEGT